MYNFCIIFLIFIILDVDKCGWNENLYIIGENVKRLKKVVEYFVKYVSMYVFLKLLILGWGIY